MHILVSSLGVLIILMSLYVMVAPAAFQQKLPELLSGASLYLIALARLLLGSLLLAVATQSRHPDIMAGLGWLTVLAGLLLVVIPPDTMSSIAQWYARLSTTTLRLMLPFAAAFGAYLVYAVSY
jgi:hypothetical protein